MAGTIFKRAVNTVFAFFALIAFFRVPLGEKTGYQHAVAIFSTEPAKEAGRSLAEVSQRMAQELTREITKLEKSVANEPAQ